MTTRRLHPLLVVALLAISSWGLARPPHAAAHPSSSGSSGTRPASPLFEEAPRGPIPLVGAPNSLVGEREGEGFTGGEGLGSVLVGYDGRKSSEILWNKPGLFSLGSYHQPHGPGRVGGVYDFFGVIDAPHRLVRLYKENYQEAFPLAGTLRTGAEPIAVAINPAYEDVSILNRGSADLWLYTFDNEGKEQPVVKTPIGGEPTDVVTQFAEGRPIFVSNAATDTVTELVGLDEGAFKFRRKIAVGKDPVDLALGEFVRRHDDEEHEVAVANRGSDTVTILDGLPGKDFSYPFHPIGTYPAGDEPVAVAAVDIDGKDGDDLAVVDAGSDRLTILLNDGRGHFHRVASYPTGRDPVAVAELRFDRSFGPDLVVANHGSHSLTVLLRHEPAICRGREAEPFTGTSGGDVLRGERGVDLIRGLGGDDKLFGHASGDCLYGGGGDDFILGNSGGDLIYGGPGDDLIYGGLPEYLPTLGRDTIVGGPGHDQIHAGAADDLVRAVDGEKDLVDCGPGDDTAFVDPEDVVSECEHVHVVRTG